ncbi:MAG: glucosidase [Chitinophagaceae bacterium]|nr:glucosidase [Chitinophagaceae bacterium]
MNKEQERLQDRKWKKWGPYLSDRQWGTVREDYSKNGEPWLYTTHEMARSKAWRWGEEGIGGISDDRQLICFAPAFWNKKDSIIKERFFGLSGYEGNHGEDVKELYYYLDSTPTHSYMKMLYKYPQSAYPYDLLVNENKNRNRAHPEFEITDTPVFDTNEYFDIFIEYAKAGAQDILVRLTLCNRSNKTAALNILPTLWFRNTWNLGYDNQQPELQVKSNNAIGICHPLLSSYKLYYEQIPELLFCDNETNTEKLYNYKSDRRFYKDGINDYIVNGSQSVNKDMRGTKAALNYDIAIPAGEQYTIRLRLGNIDLDTPFSDFDSIFNDRQSEADQFYANIQKPELNEEEKNIQRQAFAGMLWNKQFYYYDVTEWLNGDPAQPPPPPERKHGRNFQWKHLNNADIISMPDKWEYPWYAAWDLAFHCITLATIDVAFAKKQLLLLTHEWYMHPNGQLPAYEWALGDVNPPVHAWAAYKIYQSEKNKNAGKGDIAFLETIFHKLTLNFTWWVNREDETGNNVFEGGFLGMDNIGVFNRNERLTDGETLKQSDGTSWMAMYSLNLMRIALELADVNPVYQDMATKFFEHFMYIAGAMEVMGEKNEGLWDEEDEFYYDTLVSQDGSRKKMKLRSMVGLVPLFVVEIIDEALLARQPAFAERLRWFLNYRPDLAKLVSRWGEKGKDEKHLLSLLRGHRMKRILYRMLDETEFLSPYGIRSLSRVYHDQPFAFHFNGKSFEVKYAGGESPVPVFGGNSNWRGPVWMPVNYLIIESLRSFHLYYGDDFKIEYPSRSGNYFSLWQISDELVKRLKSLFVPDETGKRPIYREAGKMQTDPLFNRHILFYEYFDGDNGKGLGASHQTGWTGLIANLMQG